jgi:RNA polymerase primary sigma factor
VQRTLRGVRSRSAFAGAGTERTRSRGEDKEESLSMMKEMGSVPLLTAGEEIELARQIQDLLELERTQAALQTELNRAPSSGEWAAAVGMALPAFSERLRKGHAAKDHMVQANLRLVVSIAKKYTRRGLSFQDLVQEGSTGLIRGAEKFDFERGYKFSTYAHWWIRQAVTRAIADHSRTVRLPVHLFEIMSRMKKSQQKLAVQLGREPSEDELAAELGLTAEKVRLIHKSAVTPLSLDAPVGSDDKKPKTLEEVVEDEAVEAPERSVGYNLLREDLEGVLGTLTYREREVLRLRYGLADGHTKTLEEVGCVFRVTRERIRQIEAKALRKLRQPQRHSALSEHLDERHASLT